METKLNPFYLQKYEIILSVFIFDVNAKENDKLGQRINYIKHTIKCWLKHFWFISAHINLKSVISDSFATLMRFYVIKKDYQGIYPANV